MKVLPELIKSVEFGGGGPKALGVILKIAANMSSDDFEARIIPFIVKMFAIPDRAVRVYLLDNLPLMIDRLPQKVVNDKLFPNIVSKPCTSSKVANADIILGLRIYRRSTSSPRADPEVCAHAHH